MCLQSTNGIESSRPLVLISAYGMFIADAMKLIILIINKSLLKRTSMSEQDVIMVVVEFIALIFSTAGFSLVVSRSSSVSATASQYMSDLETF
jgi:hypothetical protein